MKQERSNLEGVKAERAVLVGLVLPDQDSGATRYDPLAELAGLAKAAGAVVVGRAIQRRSRICSATYIGSGKVRELADYAAEKDAEVIIFDNELTPSQIREIDKITARRVIDRTELILDIFASRARTFASRLQVELAQLQYTAPRLRGMWTHLERIAGGAGTAAGAVGGIGTRGPGERQIEIDRRLVQKRVTFLRSQLERIDQRKLREVRTRSEQFTVSLVGYTNAGKSTLMNALTGAQALVEDKLFATLDTTTRRADLGGNRIALLSDTVGFVRNLPHQLVASFRATLDETIHSNLILHVIDASSHDAPGQVAAVESVLTELDCQDIPRINVLNKVDAVTDDSAIHLLRNGLADSVEISALSGAGIDHLRERIADRMKDRYVQVRIEAADTNGRLLAFVGRHGHVFGTTYDNDRVLIDARMPATEISRVIQFGGRVVS